MPWSVFIELMYVVRTGTGPITSNTIDVLESVTFQVFKLVNPDAKISFLAFTSRVVKHYLKVAKVRRQLPPRIIYARKRYWEGNAAVPENEGTQGNYFVEKYS